MSYANFVGRHLPRSSSKCPSAGRTAAQTRCAMLRQRSPRWLGSGEHQIKNRCERGAVTVALRCRLDDQAITLFRKSEAAATLGAFTREVHLRDQPAMPQRCYLEVNECAAGDRCTTSA